MPFQYLYRGDDFRDLSRETRDLLDQRDQSLENYLNTFQPTLKIRRVASQYISGATAYISFDTEDSDPYGFITVPSTTITVPTGLSGLYAIGCKMLTTGSSVSDARYYISSSPTEAIQFNNPAAQANIYATVYLEDGDTVQVSVDEPSSANYTGTLWMTRILA